jgi:hypothetical protein
MLFSTNTTFAEHFIAYKHQKNGLIEAQRRCLFLIVRCWLAQSNLPLSFGISPAPQPSTSKTAYLPLLTLSPLPPTLSTTVEPPFVSQLRSWGCVVYAKLEKQKSRLHSKSIRGRFVRYSRTRRDT